MTVYLSVVFFCINSSCVFWKSNELFYNEKDCIKLTDETTKQLYENNIANFGTCLKISTKNNIQW